MRLSEHLFAWKHDSAYMDWYEKALYNHILGQQEPETGAKMYFVSLLQGHHRVYEQKDKSWWCCTGTGMENPGRYTRCCLLYTSRCVEETGTKYYKITTQFDDKALDTYKNSTSNDALKLASTTIYINAKTYLPEAMEMDLTDIFSVIDDTVYEGRTGVAYVSLNVSFVDYNSTQVILPKGDLSNSSSNKKSDDKSSQTDTTQSIFADKDYDLSLIHIL